MGDPHSTFWQEVEIAFTKALGWIVWVTIGVAAKLAFESRSRKLSWREVMIIVVISVFSGYIANNICEHTGYKDWSGVVVPIATLLGQSLMNWLMTNWKKWLEKFGDKFLPPIFRNNGKEIKND